MNDTLEEAYIHQKTLLIQEKAERALARSLIVETLELDDLKRLNTSIAQLKSLLGDTWPKFKSLQTASSLAREIVVNSAQEIDANFESFDDFKASVQSKASAKIARKLVDVFQWITALTNGFKRMPEIVNLITFASKDDEHTVTDVYETLSDEQRSVPMNKFRNVNVKRATTALIQSLRPKGLMSIISKVTGKGGVPLIDSKKFANEFASLSIDEVLGLAQRVSQAQLAFEKSDITDTVKIAQRDGKDKDESEEETSTRGSSKLERLFMKMDDDRKEAIIKLLKKYPPGS